ncbi:MAG: nucleoid-structuring protein H-NS [Comamonadaceae bacterium CG1_02_60_18]|nr:MAG: nucleoid-structuring protein H-NS [Comamonadaceae bacterium CG1_02_60_18]PIQ55522.1 MAG: nucleoid-structuring protein H-NS [Comamonadaceae bacterium CG12_big_fil_rev_8_21_14_0_65_59_15]
MTSLTEIQNQIAKLQKQAEDIKAQELQKAVQDIKDKMAAYGITVADLEAGKSRARKSTAGKTSKAGTPAAIKYRGPNGEAWSGRGLMPRWLAAEVAQGKTKESFAV